MNLARSTSGPGRGATLRCLLAALLAVSGTRADDWPQFRGLNRDGFWNETGLLEKFPADGLKVRWRQPVGFGWASPVVAKGRVFMTDSELTKPSARERVHCFEEATGSPLWTFVYEVTYAEWAFVPGQSAGPSATPIVEAGRVFTLGLNGRVHCLDAATGAVIWENDLGKSHELREMQCRPSPLIDGDRLIVFVGAKPGASVIALDKSNGKELWKALDDSISNSSPLAVNAGGQWQVIVWSNDSVTSQNPATGATWWRESMSTSGNDSIPTPVIQKNRLLISGLMFELSATEPAAKVIWPSNHATSRRLLSDTSTPMFRGDFIYSAKSGGEFVSLDASTGALVWTTDKVTVLKSGASINITPTPDGVFLFTDEGHLIRAQLSPEGYREISRAHLIDPTSPFGNHRCAWAPPAFANRHVFVRNDQEIVCASLAEVVAGDK